MRASGVSSAKIVAIAVVLLLVVGASLYFLAERTQKTGAESSTSTATGVSTTSSASVGEINVTKAYQIHLVAFQNRTACGFSEKCVYSLLALNDYGTQSSIVWEGNTGGLSGTYSGIQNIQLLYQTIMAVAQSMKFTTFDARASGDQLSLRMNLTGTSLAIGHFDGTVSADVTYSSFNGGWSISKEVWNFLVFNYQNSGDATTFPQWRTIGGPVASTKSPDPFKQFIYDYGGEAVVALIFSFGAALIVLQAMRRLGNKYRQPPHRREHAT